jgi:dTDP-4-amino-4,6-dideoxy-D-galactose acyltransferase
MPAFTLEPLEWDSALFGRKMGVLQSAAGVAFDAERAVEAARAQGYQYIVCRPSIEDGPLIHALGLARFYLSDQGLTWATAVRADARIDPAVVPATDADIPSLQQLIRFMFRDSRFYHDPFFSTDDAEMLHQEWIKNSVKGQAADGVLWIPEAGFVTLKQRGPTGEIALVGIAPGQRGRGLGRQLVAAAIAWCGGRGATQVHVRTQVRNLRANNFYRANGFELAAADVTFSRVL